MVDVVILAGNALPSTPDDCGIYLVDNAWHAWYNRAMINGINDIDERSVGYWWSRIRDAYPMAWRYGLVDIDWDDMPESIKHDMRCMYRMAKHVAETHEHLQR